MKKIIMLLSLVTLVSCASQAEKDIETETAAVKPAASMTILMERHKAKIMSSEVLSDVQKEKLLNLQMNTYTQAKTYTTEIKKLKTVMLKNLMSKKYSEKKNNIVTKKIRKLNSQRMDLMFDTLKEAKTILGKNSTDESLQELWYLHDGR
jgi:hypothetical protein